MAIVSSVFDFLRDSKKIIDWPSGGNTDRFGLWAAYLRLMFLTATRRGMGEVSFLGYKIRYLNPKSLFHLYKEIFVDRYYDLLAESETPRIIDCGSNIGMSIIFFKHKYPRATIIGFEPHPTTFQMLMDNIKQNGFQHVDVYQQAISDRCGTIDFFVNNGGHNLEALEMSIMAGRGGAPIQVSTNRLSTFVDGEMDLLKLDIEGAEELVLKDLTENGNLQNFKQIVCEYHHHREGPVDSLSVTLAMLENAGFGYQLKAYHNINSKKSDYQDVLIYAYRK